MRKPQLGRKAPLRPVKPPFLKDSKPPAKRPKTAAHNSDNRNQGKVDKGSWGGPRRKVGFSEYLTYREVKAIKVAAFDAAFALGSPLNLFVTINWGKYTIEDEYALAALQKFLKLVSDWLRTRGLDRVFVWAREIGKSMMASHAHILLHCPSHVAIARRFRRWLRIATGQTYKKDAVKTKRIGRTTNCYLTNPALYLVNLHKTVEYIAKGVHPDVASELGVLDPVYSGGIIGKRSAVSGALSAMLDLQSRPRF